MTLVKARYFSDSQLIRVDNSNAPLTVTLPEGVYRIGLVTYSKITTSSAAAFYGSVLFPSNVFFRQIDGDADIPNREFYTDGGDIVLGFTGSVSINDRADFCIYRVG